MTREELKRKIDKVLDEIENPCERCADDDFKPSNCEHFHPNWEEEGLETFCDTSLKEPIDEIMDYIDEYTGDKDK